MAEKVEIKFGPPPPVPKKPDLKNTSKAYRKEMKQIRKTINNNKAASKEIAKIRPISELERSNDKAVRELLNAILLQEKPYVLPRMGGTNVAPHQYNWTKTIKLDTVNKLKGAFLVTNDLDGLLHLGETSDANQTLSVDTYSGSPGVSITYPNATKVTLDYDLKFTNGKTFKTSTAPLGVGLHWSNSANKFQTGFKYYPGVFAAAPAVTMYFNNVSNRAGTITWEAGYVDANGNPVPVIQTAVALVNGLNTVVLSADPNYAAWVAAVTSGVNKGFYFAESYGFTSSSSEGYGNYIGMRITAAVDLVNPFQWTVYPLWNLMSDSEAAALQYRKSARHNVTGNHVVFTNNTADLQKGGSIFGARLPGNTFTDIPHNVDGLISLISSQTHHKMTSSSLKDGMAYSFTPEKLQDWLFERPVLMDPYGGNSENLPYCAVAYDASNIALAGSYPVFTFTGKVSVEYLTTDPSNWFVPSPNIAPVFEALLNCLAEVNCVSENPNHFDHIKKVVSSVMTKDNMKYALKTLVQAGIKLAPFALTLLA